MNRNKKMIILLVILIIIVAAYFGVTKWSAAQDDSASDESGITVAQVAQEEITGLTWTFMGNEYSVVKQDGIWTAPADPDFEVNQSLAEYMASVIAEVSALQTIETVDDYSQYGLDKPALKITADTAGEPAFTLLIGNTNEITSDYYAMIEGQSEVHIIDLVYAYNFSCTLEEMKALSDEELKQLAESLSES